MTVLYDSDEYKRLSARWNELFMLHLGRGRTPAEEAEIETINAQLEAAYLAHDAAAAARSDTQAIAALGVICTDYEAQREALSDEL